MNELNSLYAAGWRDSILIVDDNFIGNKAVLKIAFPEETSGVVTDEEYPRAAAVRLALDKQGELGF